MRKILILAGLLFLFSVVSAWPSVQVAAATTASNTTFTTSDSPNILINPVQGPSVSQQLAKRAQSSWAWYVTRASGFVAAISLVMLMLSGIGFITGATFRFLEPLTAWATHKAIAYVFGVSVLIHGGALLFDKFVPFTPAQALIPFLSTYQEITYAGHHFGSLFVAFGIFAMYCVAAIIFTSILWIDKDPHTWKLFHFLSYATMVLVFFHALFVGTDLAHGVFRILWILAGIGVAMAILYRVRRRA